MRKLLSLLLLLTPLAFGDDADVLYRTVDGVELRLDIALPEGAGPFPAIICLHGGGWSMGSKSSFRKIIKEFAASGYVAATIQYRLTPRFPYPAQLDDTLEAIRFLRTNADRWKIDRNRVVVLGTSAGAHLALLAGFAAAGTKDQVQAIIDISAPTDLRDWKMQEDADRNLRTTTGKSGDMLVTELLGTADRNPQKVQDASPLLQVRRGVPPVLIFQWKDDRAVPAVQAERLAGALETAGVRFEMVWFKGRGHALMGAGVETIVPRTVAFLQKVLGTP
jgi:acetyl esterase/lipase